MDEFFYAQCFLEHPFQPSIVRKVIHTPIYGVIRQNAHQEYRCGGLFLKNPDLKSAERLANESLIPVTQD
jgi:hypothetical protein